MSSYFCHVKTNIFNDANPHQRFPTPSDMAESKLQPLYIYIWTKFDNCALSLNSSGKFKRMVIAGLKQTKQKTGSPIWDYERNFFFLNHCHWPCSTFKDRGLAISVPDCHCSRRLKPFFFIRGHFHLGPLSLQFDVLAHTTETGGTCDPWSLLWKKSGSRIHVAMYSFSWKTITHRLTNANECT